MFRVVLLLLVSQHLSLLWQVFMTSCVNKTIPIHFIDGRCHIKQLKAGKKGKTCLTNHTRSISHHIIPPVIKVLKGRHTDRHRHTHNDMQTKAISRNWVATMLTPFIISTILLMFLLKQPIHILKIKLHKIIKFSSDCLIFPSLSSLPL